MGLDVAAASRRRRARANVPGGRSPVAAFAIPSVAALIGLGSFATASLSSSLRHPSASSVPCRLGAAVEYAPSVQADVCRTASMPRVLALIGEAAVNFGGTSLGRRRSRRTVRQSGTYRALMHLGTILETVQSGPCFDDGRQMQTSAGSCGHRTRRRGRRCIWLFRPRAQNTRQVAFRPDVISRSSALIRPTTSDARLRSRISRLKSVLATSSRSSFLAITRLFNQLAAGADVCGWQRAMAGESETIQKRRAPLMAARQAAT